MLQNTTKDSLAGEYRFLSGGGEMGMLMRNYDWSQTSIGTPGLWPQSLRTTLSIILASRFPMFLFWGPDLISFYNDAYRPSLGNDGKHPHILGMPGKEAWPEIWDTIGPLIDQVLSGRGATYHEDQLIPIFRNGKIEDVYWTFSYSPVVDETNQPAGVFVTCTETTEKIFNLKRIREKEQQFRGLIIESPFPTALMIGPELVIDIANKAALKLWGKDEAVIGKKLTDAIPELSGQPFINYLRQVYKTGETYNGFEELAYLEINGELKPVYLNFIYKALYDGEGKVYGLLTTGYDVTEQIEARKKLEYSEERSRLSVEAALLGTFDFDVPSSKMVFSERVFAIFGHNDASPSYQQLVGQLHPDDLHLRETANRQAAVTGSVSYELRIIWPDQSIHWVHLHGRVFLDEGKKPNRVIGTIKDITEQKAFVDSIQSAEKKFRNTVRQAPVGIVILRGIDFIVESSNDKYLELVDRTEEEFVGKPLFDSLPEVRNSVEPLLRQVFETGEPYQGVEFPVTINRYGKHEQSYFNFIYQALRDEKNEVSGVIVVATDVTVSVNARQLLAESEKQFRNLVMQAPVAMAIFRGEHFIIDTVNEAILNKVWFRTREQVIGKPLLEVFPELKEQIFPQLLLNVYQTGIPYKQNEAQAYVDTPEGRKNYYLDFEYAPLFESDRTISAIMITVHDITEKVEARQKVEDAEERLRLAAEGTGLATWDLDLKTENIIYSTRLTEIFGHPDSKILNHQDMRNQVHPDDRNLLDNAFENALHTGVYEYEVRVVRPNGTLCWIKTIGTVIFNEDQIPQRMIGTLRDITEQKLISDTLKSSEEKFRLLADFMPQLIWTGDQSGELNYYNKAFYDYSGLSFEALQKDGWFQIVHPEDRQEGISRWMRSVATGDDFICEHRFRRYDGEYRWQLSRAVAQRDQEGNVQMWVGTSTDIHDIKELEQQKDFFISMASHELKTPLTSIRGYVQILQNLYQQSTDKFLNNSLNIIDKQIGTLSKLISELLDLSKIKAGNLMLSREYFDLDQLVNETIDEIVHVNPEYTINFQSGGDGKVYADRQRIGQVLVNLLTNAVKYSPNSKTINIKSFNENGESIITVQDFGIGINKSDQGKIFERFYRVEGKDEKTFPGFGIGLFIASEIIYRHHGKIGVNSVPGKGSKFYFSFPNKDD